MKVIARIYGDFPTKFGLPRQSGLAESVQSLIIFEPEYQNPESVRGLENFSHIWLIWQFSQSLNKDWSPTVRPPRLGGNTRMGVFATRSPFRPNPVGLSSVKLNRIEFTQDKGPVLHISGADMVDGTPIFDIKPYLPFTDSHPDATYGFAKSTEKYSLEVDFPDKLLSEIPGDKIEVLKEILSQDPRPSYHDDPNRIYGFEFAEFEIKFRVSADGVLTVCHVGKTGGKTKNDT